MAKQSGLHQLKGKIGDHSYYRQSGVENGLVRRINAGMSARVRTAPEFANTRLNNAEFGAAANTASVLISGIVPKYRAMLISFAQSKLTTALVALIKAQVDESWGQRNVLAVQVDSVVQALNTLAKNSFAELFGELVVARPEAGKNSIALTFTDSVVSALQSLGISGVSFRIYSQKLAAGGYNPETGKINESHLYGVAGSIQDAPVRTGEAFNLEMPYNTADIEGAQTMSLYSVIALPYRTINGTKHTMQQYCTFTSFAAITE